MRTIVLLNACPGAGKDVIANYLQENYGFWHIKFADVIRSVVSATFGIPNEEIDQWKSQEIGPGLGTGRDFMISFSEEFIKPRFDRAFFAIQTAERVLAAKDQLLVVSDVGFIYEACAFIRHIRENSDEEVRFCLWHIHRDGTSFKGDSRGWVWLKEFPAVIIENNGTLKDLYERVDSEMVNLNWHYQLSEALNYECA